MESILLVSRMTYVLQLADGKFYVGMTYNLNQRYAEHIQGRGAKWTRLHRPVRILSVEVGDLEYEVTLRLMREKGWQNVRGSKYCKIDMTAPPPELLDESIQNGSYSPQKCGGPRH